MILFCPSEKDYTRIKRTACAAEKPSVIHALLSAAVIVRLQYNKDAQREAYSFSNSIFCNNILTVKIITVRVVLSGVYSVGRLLIGIHALSEASAVPD